MITDGRGHHATGDPADQEPHKDAVVAQLVEHIGDLESQLDLNEHGPDGVDIAIEAAAELALIYSHLGDMPTRDRMLDRLNRLVSDHSTSARKRLASKVYAQIAARPGRAAA